MTKFSTECLATFIDPFLLKSNWEDYSREYQKTWNFLIQKQKQILLGRTIPLFLQNLTDLKINEQYVPDLEYLNQCLRKKTGWKLVITQCPVPDEIFFKLLSQKVFPVGCFIRSSHTLEHFDEPDFFHTIYGHVPMLYDNFWSEVLFLLGQKGLEACQAGALHYFHRLYWYIFKIGILRHDGHLYAYGASLLSSSKECMHALESKDAKRLPFSLERVLRTVYDDFKVQNLYFVIDSLETIKEVLSTDLEAMYEDLVLLENLPSDRILPEEECLLISPNPSIG